MMVAIEADLSFKTVKKWASGVRVRPSTERAIEKALRTITEKTRATFEAEMAR